MSAKRYSGMYSIWLVPEGRWLTVWDFLRKNKQGLEDAIPVFLNSPAAEAAVNALHSFIRPGCVVTAIAIDPPAHVV